MQLRRSMRNSATPSTLPTPESPSHDDDDDNEHNRDHYVSTERPTIRQQSTDSLDSNSTGAIAARYADYRVPEMPTVSAENRGDSGDRSASSSQSDSFIRSSTVSDTAGTLTATVASHNDSVDVTLPVTTAPYMDPPARLLSSISTTGSVGGATAAGIGADYLAVTVDQKSSVS